MHRILSREQFASQVVPRTLACRINLLDSQNVDDKPQWLKSTSGQIGNGLVRLPTMVGSWPGRGKDRTPGTHATSDCSSG